MANNTTKMNYSFAVKELFNKPKNIKNKKTVYDLPKGWIHLKKDGSIEDNRTQEEIQEFEDKLKNDKIYYGMQKICNRFIKNKKFELERDGYNEEEIDCIIYNMLNDFEDEEYDSLSENEFSDNEFSDYESS